MPKDEPLVSVIIPVWNTAERVGKLLKELFDQTYPNLEIIAIDDGSSDNSLPILLALAKNEPRLKVIHQENAGVSAARNRGIEVATGEYLVFVDSDDNVAPEYIQELVVAMERNPRAVLALTGKTYNKLYENKSVEIFAKKRRPRRKRERLSHYTIYLMILDGRMYSMTSKIFRADIIRQYNIRLEEGRDFAEDTKFTIDYLAAKDGEIIFIPRPLYIYNFGTETSLVQKSSLKWSNWEKSYQDLAEWARAENQGKLSIGTRGLLALIRSRWHISYYKARRRAKQKTKSNPTVLHKP